MMNTSLLIQNDPWLKPFSKYIAERKPRADHKEYELTGGASLSEFATGYLYFGLHRTANGWVFREWAPNATNVYLIGDFSNWQIVSEYALHQKANGVWEIELPEEKLWHGALYRLLIRWRGGEGERIPSYANRCVQDKKSKVFSAQVWNPKQPYVWQSPVPDLNNAVPLIYESHVGMATEELRVGTFAEYRDQIIPYIQQSGYNTVQLMAIQEHPYYGSFGYHVSNFFAVSSRFGTPDDFKSLVDSAHGLGLHVIMDLVHSHSVKNTLEGLNLFDGTPSLYFYGDNRREHPAWDSLCFDYGKNEVLHFLLSNCKYWLEEYKIDGFRFDGVTSMLYHHHGLSKDFTEYSMYFDGSENTDATSYIMLANKLIHEVKPTAVTIAEEMSGMPGVATPIDCGGIGFDYRLAMGTPDYWIKLIKDKSDNEWNVGEMYYELTRKRSDEKTIGYAESHDQALVGDKTIFFRLVDMEIYNHMAISDKSVVIDRGMALHKMIRLATIATAGNGYLCFMGNEFGHPEWIDFPREGNNWSYRYARRQWGLIRDAHLKFHFLAAFDKEMLSLTGNSNFFSHPPELLLDDHKQHILAFRRNELVFVFNFHPDRSCTDYGIPTGHGKFRIVLNTDSGRFDGFNRIDESMDYFTSSIIADRPMENTYLKVYIPARCALVFKKMPAKSIYEI
ncbi:MAG: alpha amylase C-terminal domain-containing protein [Bacteroidales bacterium]|jgi:1,4-alpha-glucan branching enzyme|nr:alpha amylase C-terminal domain-containing protein [Bacteroidales bacterium]